MAYKHETQCLIFVSEYAADDWNLTESTKCNRIYWSPPIYLNLTYHQVQMEGYTRL